MDLGAYETWVRRLREWSTNPYIELDDLPVLDEKRVPAATFARLTKQILKAMGKVMERWNAEFDREVSKANTEHELSMAFIRARGLLACRVKLARHPSLPRDLQEALYKATVEDIHSLQDQLEKIVSSQENRWGINSDRSTTVRIVKGCPLTAVLTEDYVDRARVFNVVDAAEEYNLKLVAERQLDSEAQIQSVQSKTGIFSRLFKK